MNASNGWTGEQKPAGDGGKWPLSIRQPDPGTSSGNPLLDRYPEPARKRRQRPVLWRTMAVVAVVLVVILVGGHYLLASTGRPDPALWGRAMELLSLHKSVPADAATLRKIRGLIGRIEPEESTDKPRCALTAVYALGSLKAGKVKDWSAAGAVLEREFPDSKYVVLVNGVAPGKSSGFACPDCAGNGICTKCGETGSRTTPGLSRETKGKRIEIGTSLGKSRSGVKCSLCKGSRKCRKCAGTGSVVRSRKYPVPDSAETQQRWALAVKKATRSVRLKYWQARLVNLLVRMTPESKSEGETVPEAVEDDDWTVTEFPVAPDGLPGESEVTGSAPKAFSRGTSTADSTGEGDLPAKISLYKLQIGKISKLYDGREKELADGHLGNLRAMQTELRKKGDLGGWERLEAEIAGFAKSQETDEPSEFSQVNDLRAAYRVSLLGLQLGRTREIVAACKHHVQAVTMLMRQLTRENMIEEAKAARESLKELESALNDARFGAAMIESDLKKAKLAGGAAQPEETLKLDIEQLANLRSIFEREAAAIENEYAADMASWGNAYAAALEQLKAAMQDRGDLEGWEAVDQELNRFIKERDIKSILPYDSPARLKSEREKYRNLRKNYPVERDRKIATLTGLCSKHLENLKRAYVRDGKIAQAQEVRKEIARLTEAK